MPHCPSIIRLFAAVVLRHALRHPVVAALNLLGIGLGVAVYLAIQTANASADAAFRASIDTVAGRSHLEVRDAPETVFPTVAAHPLVASATPIVEVYATLPDHPGRYLRILGVDLFTSQPFQSWSFPEDAGAPGGGDFTRFLASPNTLALPRATAESLGLGIGDALTAQVNARTVTLTTGFLLEGDDGRGTSSDLAVMDIGWAQELAGTSGTLTSIQIRLHAPAAARDALATLAEILPPATTIGTPEQRGTQIQSMLEGFQLNLRALSMVSVLVGVFLIYNTVSASVVRRRKEIGTLRAIGASRSQVTALFLGEGALLGLLGSALGIPLGLAGASALMDEVARTISVHYVLVSITGLAIAPADILLALGYGVAAALFGAWMPAREAAGTDPLRALQPGQLYGRTRVRTGSLSIAGAATFVAAVGLAVLALLTGPAWLSFVACLAVIASFSLAAPGASVALARVLALARHGLPAAAVRTRALVDIARENFVRSLHRSTATVVALMAALAMAVGVTVMIASFRNTVDRWVGRTMVADLYVGPASNAVLGLQAHLPASLRPFLESLPGIDSVDSYREERVRLGDGQDYALGIIDAPDRQNLSFAKGDSEGYLARGELLVNEALANKLDLAPGDTLTLGGRTLPISGIFFDYSDDHGTLYLASDHSPFPDAAPHSLAAYLDPGADTDAIAAEIRAAFGQDGELVILSQRELRQRILEIFDQTFAITGILRTIAVAVAVIGIVLSLTILVAERGREIAMFRAVGGSSKQLCATYLTEAGLIGLTAGLLGTACGLCLAVVLTWVVNKAFFGWTVQFEIPVYEILVAPLWVTAVAVAAGALPALKAARAPLSNALRSE
ncbi:FtsX-like permease family protein [soil metagenome]